jgi:replicative DNA helicase
MIKRLLRSIIEFDQEVSPENLIRNFQLLRRSVDAGRLEWGRPDDESLYNFALGFFSQHFDMPSAQSVQDYFQSINGVEAIERLNDISAERPYARTNFVHLLKTIQEEQASLKLRVAMKEFNEILTKGIKDEKTGEVVKGAEAAVLHFHRKSQEILIPEQGDQVNGDIRQDADLMVAEYEKTEADPGSSYGVLCGINEIDDACKGIKKGELWIHAAFPSHGKTMFANNWAYNAVTRFKTNIVFISLEMTRPIMRRNAYALHTANAKFFAQGYQPLDYRDIRDGKLTPEQKKFYTQVVCPDFKNNPTYGTYELVIPDRGWTMSDIKTNLELLNREFEVGMVIIDYGLLVTPESKDTSHVVKMNSIITASKQLALHFNKGAMVPVLMLFQTNRSGKEEADKNDGIYQMNALSWANSAEKDADVITAAYFNKELKDSGRLKFSNLKNRDNAAFEPFEAHVHWAPRRIASGKRSEPQGFSVDACDQFLNNMDNMDALQL